MPTSSAPISTLGSPRGSRLNSERPSSWAIIAVCTSSGRRKSTVMSPVRIRSAMSTRPIRLTEPSMPWLIQM